MILSSVVIRLHVCRLVTIHSMFKVILKSFLSVLLGKMIPGYCWDRSTRCDYDL